MEDKTFERLFELSYIRDDHFVTPVFLEYFTLESYGLEEDDAIEVMEERYRKRR